MNLIDENSKILVELDCLLDTRLGTLSVINEAAAMELLASNRYIDRVSDNWTYLTNGVVTTEEFNARYEQRDQAVLAASRPTDLLLHIRPMLIHLERKAYSEPIVQDLTLQINYYPYKLTQREQKFIAEIMVQKYTGAFTAVEMVSIPPKDLIPQRLRTDYGIVIIYDFNNWLKYNIEKLAECPIPAVHLVTPALDYTLSTTRKVFHGVSEDFLSNPHIAQEFYMAEFIGLANHPVREFSLLVLDNKKEKQQEG